MCRELDQLRGAIRQYASAFDARALTPGEARIVARSCGAIEASAVAMKALAAARAAQGEGWKAAGYRSASEQLAKETGTSVGTARSVLDTGRRMCEQPEVAQAALSGVLSPQQASLVANGAEANPTKASELIRKAQEESLSELQDEVSCIKAAATDAEARRRAIRARRAFQSWTDPEGAWHARAYGNPEDGAHLRSVIDKIRRRLVIVGRERGERERFEALSFDALIALARIAEGADSDITLADLRDLGLFPDLADLAPEPSEPSVPFVPSEPSEPEPPWTPSLPDAAPQPAAPTTPDAALSLGAGPAPAAPPSSEATSPADGGIPDRPQRLTVPSFPAEPPVPVGPSPPPTLFEPTGQPSPPSSRVPSRPPPAPETSDAPPPTSGPSRSGSERGPGKRSRRRKLAGSRVELQVRVDLDTLLRGVPAEGELCEIVGYGPIAVSTIEELLAHDDVFLTAILTRAKGIVGVTRYGRAPNVDQKSALAFLYPTCAVLGCGAKASLQADHREDWARTHFTVFDLMDRLCTHHHALKTRQNWALVAGKGRRAFVPPSDPRHPRRAPDRSTGCNTSNT